MKYSARLFLALILIIMMLSSCATYTPVPMNQGITAKKSDKGCRYKYLKPERKYTKQIVKFECKF